LLIVIVEQNLVRIDPTVAAVTLLLLRNTHDAPCHRAHCVKTRRHPQNRKYVTSQRTQRKTEPRPQATCTENLVKWTVWFSRYGNGQRNEQTDIQKPTCKLAHHDTSHPSRSRVGSITF